MGVPVRVGPAPGLDGLRGPLLGSGDLLHPDHGVVLGELDQHVRPQGLVVARLGQRCFQVGADVVVASYDALHEEHVREHPGRRFGEVVDPVGEQVGDPLPFPGDEQVAAELQQAGHGGRGVGGRQAQRVGAEVDRQAWRSAVRRGDGGRGGSGREIVVGARRRHRQVQDPALLVGDDTGERAMDVPGLGVGRVSSGGRGQQRVRGPDPLAVGHRDALLEGLLEASGAGDGPQLVGPQVSVEGEGQQDLAYVGLQVRDAPPDQVLHVVGDRDVLPQHVEVPVRQDPPDLQREERVAEGRVHHPPQHVVRQAQPEPVREHVPGRAEAEREHRDLPRTLPGHRTLQRRPLPRATGQQERDGFADQPADDERERVVRRAVEPLHVVDRHEQLPALRERPQGRQ